MIDDANGATHQVLARNLSKTDTSSNWAIKKAVPDANAIRTYHLAGFTYPVVSVDQIGD